LIIKRKLWINLSNRSVRSTLKLMSSYLFYHELYTFYIKLELKWRTQNAIESLILMTLSSNSQRQFMISSPSPWRNMRYRGSPQWQGLSSFSNQCSWNCKPQFKSAGTLMGSLKISKQFLDCLVYLANEATFFLATTWIVASSLLNAFVFYSLTRLNIPITFFF